MLLARAQMTDVAMGSRWLLYLVARQNVRLLDGEEPLFLLPADIKGAPFDTTDPSEHKALFRGSFTFQSGLGSERTMPMARV